jgi:hypothetical protein
MYYLNLLRYQFLFEKKLTFNGSKRRCSHKPLLSSEEAILPHWKAAVIDASTLSLYKI